MVRNTDAQLQNDEEISLVVRLWETRGWRPWTRAAR